MSIIKDLISGGIKGIGETAKGIIQQVAENKLNVSEAALAIDKEANRHQEAIDSAMLEQQKLENAEKDSARTREAEFVKSTGHIDWFQTGFGAVMLLLFAYTIYVSSNGSIPQDMREIFIEGRAAVRDIVLAIAGYYWGSSAGSRVKDIKPSK